MQLIVPPEIVSQLINALRQAGRREIGGILMGEYVGQDSFRVKELTIQRKRGTFATFTRIVADILAPLRAFFDKTTHNYTRFNYMGEWHSHHSFGLSPSGPDHLTMCEIMADPNLGARFVVLLLVRLTVHGELESNVVVYRPNKAPYRGKVLQEKLL
jgi:hypothetical protein